jgi:hypothetical protein
MAKVVLILVPAGGWQMLAGSVPREAEMQSHRWRRRKVVPIRLSFTAMRLWYRTGWFSTSVRPLLTWRRVISCESIDFRSICDDPPKCKCADQGVEAGLVVKACWETF